MQLLDDALSLFEYTQTLRRDFHRHPEIGFQEVRTASIVARELTQLGLEVTTGVGRTGVVALLEGARPGPVVMLRFDMDALPILEATGAEYASLNPGVMHACGHDGHTAIGITVARLLQRLNADFSGTIKFAFQPAEEGLGGAESMIADGVLQNPKPDYILGLHLWNEKPFWWVGISSGPVMAASEIFTVQIIGKGGHGAIPNLANDPVLAAAQVVSGMQSIVSRNISPLEAAVISVTTIHGGDTFNVIPPKVVITGTIRTYNPEVRQRVLQRFEQLVSGVAAAFNCQADIELRSTTPALINHPNVAAVVRAAAERLWGAEPVDDAFQTMGSEDMAFLMQDIPGCYFFVGSANHEKGLNAPHHHPRFDIDEQALPKAAALMALSTLKLLSR